MYMERIKVLSTEEELLEVGRFRYKIYVEEMKRSQKYADDFSKTIIEPEDKLPQTRIIIAYIDGELVGTSRIQIYRPGDNISNLADYDIPKDITENFTISEGTKYMIKPSLRGRNNTGTSMMKLAYQLLLDEKVDVDFLNANDYLINYYGSRGYRKYGNNYIHKELRQFVYPMALIVRDFEYLKSINSPFAYVQEASLYRQDTNRNDMISRALFGII